MILIGCVILGAGCAKMPTNSSGSNQKYEIDTIISTQKGKPISFEAMIDELAGASLVFVGERHTNPDHHEIQLRILEALHERRPGNLAVGMEMFAHTYQDVLNDWSSGKLDEQAFIRRTHWKVNWKFDYSLYRPLLNFIRSHEIKLLGLNVPFHIPSKIAAGGLDSLNSCEKERLPEEMDFGKVAHRDYIRRIFEKNPHGGLGYKFEDFYAAQVSWEETMAHTVSRYLDDRLMVIFAGSGHIAHGYGIPERAYSRTRARYLTVIPIEADQPVDYKSADFIWITPHGDSRSHPVGIN